MEWFLQNVIIRGWDEKEGQNCGQCFWDAKGVLFVKQGNDNGNFVKELQRTLSEV